MTRLRSDQGHTLIELLLAAMLTLLISGAALTTLERGVTLNKKNQQLMDDTEASRNAIDLLARDIRDATAYQTTSNTSAASVLLANPQDFVFKTVDPKAAVTTGNDYRVRTVRYCYSPTTKMLLRQTRANAVLPGASCPDTSWTTTARVPNVVNAARPLFTYDSADANLITRAIMSLFVDSTPNRAPVETPLSSGVFLRNASRPPEASFTAIATDMHVQLNGSASLDPEGGTLKYTWKDGATTLEQALPVVDYVAPTAGTHTFTLTVTDRGGLTATTTQTLTVQP